MAPLNAERGFPDLGDVTNTVNDIKSKLDGLSIPSADDIKKVVPSADDIKKMIPSLDDIGNKVSTSLKDAIAKADTFKDAIGDGIKNVIQDKIGAFIRNSIGILVGIIILAIVLNVIIKAIIGKFGEAIWRGLCKCCSRRGTKARDHHEVELTEIRRDSQVRLGTQGEQDFAQGEDVTTYPVYPGRTFTDDKELR